MSIRFLWLAFVFSAGCVDETPLFPADYAATYTLERECRRSGDHDLQYVKVLVDEVARASYEQRADAFPEGATVLKEQYLQPDCTQLAGWTVMKRGAPGSVPASGDWQWQHVKADRSVVNDGAPARCAACHQTCGVPPDGYDWTCEAP